MAGLLGPAALTFAAPSGPQVALPSPRDGFVRLAARGGGGLDAQRSLAVGAAVASAALVVRGRRQKGFAPGGRRGCSLAVRALKWPFEYEEKKSEKGASRDREKGDDAVLSQEAIDLRRKLRNRLPTFDELDVDGDGVLTRAEYEALVPPPPEVSTSKGIKTAGCAAGQAAEQQVIPDILEQLQADIEPLSDEVVSDILQFDAGVYFVEEEEGSMTLDVMRLGSMKGECSVKFKTMDGSAIAGQRYEATEGELHFKDKETCKSIEVPIIDSDQWSTTLEFKLLLYDPVGCELGRYLYVSRVKVIDGDTFPTNRFNKEIEERGLERLTKGEGAVNPADLLIEYFKLNFSLDVVRWKTIATASIDQLQNIYFLLTVNLLKYVADDVLAAEAKPEGFLVPGDQNSTLLLVGALYLVPYGVLNIMDIWKSQLGLAEDSKAYLRENMFRKFMNYDDQSRDRVPSSERVLAMTKDTDDIVDEGYMKTLEILKTSGKLAVSSYFIIQENPEGLGPIVVFGLAVVGFLTVKGDENVRVQEAISKQESVIVSEIQDSAQKYRLIADYRMRPAIQDRLEGNVKALTRASIPVTTLECTNDYFPGWLANLLTAGYIIYGGEQVVAGELQIGAFLSTAGVIKEVGDSFKDIFTSLLSISQAIEPMQDITLFMNLPTDLRAMKKINRQRRRRTKEERAPGRLSELRRRTGVRFATDAIPIQINGVRFMYPGTGKWAIAKFDVTVPQGSLVAVVGPRREGKSTVMRLMGQVVTPTEGEIFVPAHLRILHASQQPILLNASPWENLAIGRQYWKDLEFESKRAVKICKRLGIAPPLIEHLEETREHFIEHGTTDPPSSRWTESLNSSDAALIHLGRAFIYNPEVLVIHRPTLLLSGRSSDNVLEMLREFVDRRGVELPIDLCGRRRPRTALASFARSRGVELADIVWGVQESVVAEIPKSEVSELLLA